ncbi:bifunctional lysylphosphatidylglycerol flippase/synthetase MprF [Corynebacterium sp.]|uniref:bifunctional lysylphosphatidylglycerol flippase/synthetase MprF n=1 Tax=Corynebacterium sp. TaxID=1720 RepID=UPI0026DB7CFD|nr:phosphatidylglycerol lysyltransferase domain-containing protein [Corynebacterium sp.]MDO5032868.1 phosphatidylglycerol lysyltransferase domain-containing protein [Corynebacterium sp.]
MTMFTSETFTKTIPAALWRARTLAAGVPVTCGLLLSMWLAFAARGVLPPVLPALLTASTLGGLASLSLLALALCIPAERVLGSRGMLLAGLGIELLAVPVALVAARGIELAGLNRWGEDLLHSTQLTPIAFIVGAAGCASAWMPRLWQRRVRVVILALMATMALYSGSLADVLGTTAAFMSIAAGIAWALLCRGRAEGGVMPVGWASTSEKRVLTAIVVGAVALGPLLVALNPAAEGPFSPVTQLMWSGDVSAYQAQAACAADSASQLCREAVDFSRVSGLGPLVANLMPAVIQLVVCFGLMRGRRAAWWAACAIQPIVMAVLLTQLADLDADGIVLYGVNLATVVLPWLACLVVLLWNRRAFSVRESRAELRRALRRVLAVAALCAGVWCAGAYGLRESFLGGAGWPEILGELPLRFLPPVVGLMFPYWMVPNSAASWMLYEWTGTVLWLAVAWVAYRMFATPADPAAEATRARARAVLDQGSGDHLSFMSLWPGNRYFFNAAGTGYVAYRAWGGVALTLGEPVGCERAQVAEEFEAFAREQGLRPAWYSVGASFQRPGFSRVEVAEEAVLSTEHADFKGKKFQNVRTARNRAVTEGVRTYWSTWEELSLVMQSRISELSESWVVDKALPEMGFTLGGLAEMQVPGTRLLVGVDKQGALHGVTSWLPVREEGRLVGYTLDVMRRAEGGFKGVMEFLISEALLVAKEEGCGWISLSGAPLAAHPENPGLVDALLARLGQGMEPVYGFRSLAASKRKFQPQEHTWYVVYEDELALPAIGMAVAHAYLPQMRPADAARAVKAWRQARARVRQV